VCEFWFKVRKPQTEGRYTNMGADFSHLGALAKNAIAVLDHSHLNDALKEDNPTSEYVAEWLFNRITAQMELTKAESWMQALLGTGVRLFKVVVEETEDSRCEFEK
jgi:6-pyruvoyl-tetrahydropterin synthase